jgi:hypothetical protein
MMNNRRLKTFKTAKARNQFYEYREDKTKEDTVMANPNKVICAVPGCCHALENLESVDPGDGRVIDKIYKCPIHPNGA